ncbi:MAG: hypothetical protein OXG15_10455 [Gammaproteobacteria bacterium]|nr:hypothetical protein [Gammaproteobacteria bacterium]
MKQKSAPSQSLHLTSRRNPVVRQARDLKKRRFRNDSQLFRIEGHREIKRALEAGIEFEYVVYCDAISRFTQSESTLTRIESQSDATLYASSVNVFANLSQWQNPDGLLVIAKQQKKALTDIRADTNDVFLVIDGVEKPGNLGSMFRTADATGCSGILISDPVVDLFNPNVIRASLGTVFAMPCAIAESTDVVRWLRENQLNIVCSSPQGSRSFLEAPLGSGCAIVIGSEKDGLSDTWFEACDEVVSLPKEGFADSMNAAMAANALLFESYRQRQPSVKPSGSPNRS